MTPDFDYMKQVVRNTIDSPPPPPPAPSAAPTAAAPPPAADDSDSVDDAVDDAAGTVTLLSRTGALFLIETDGDTQVKRFGESAVLADLEAGDFAKAKVGDDGFADKVEVGTSSSVGTFPFVGGGGGDDHDDHDDDHGNGKKGKGGNDD